MSCTRSPIILIVYIYFGFLLKGLFVLAANCFCFVLFGVLRFYDLLYFIYILLPIKAARPHEGFTTSQVLKQLDILTNILNASDGVD